jgi:hypothetical protein
MQLHSPSTFYPELTDDRLRAVAMRLLDLRFSTLSEMHSPYDDNYTREGTVFGRTRNMLIALARKGPYSWLTLAHAGMDVTVNIGNVPVRYFRDDPKAPGKGGFFKRNAVDDLFAMDDSAPVMWRFIVERAMAEDAEDVAHFIGYNVYQEPVSGWVYRPSKPTLHSLDGDTPPSTILPPASVQLLEDDESSSDDRKAANNE